MLLIVATILLFSLTSVGVAPFRFVFVVMSDTHQNPENEGNGQVVGRLHLEKNDAGGAVYLAAPLLLETGPQIARCALDFQTASAVIIS
ncbi:MAG: hypothetical protein M0009_07285 [Deltaproteobacteria bacterium]|nr:hypothetical protein [Deltaproteobacteria bacterium]